MIGNPFLYLYSNCSYFIYFVLDLRKKKDIRKFISCIEKTIIGTLKDYKIETFSDKDNVGIWHKKNHTINKVAAIGIKVKKWIAYQLSFLI